MLRWLNSRLYKETVKDPKILVIEELCLDRDCGYERETELVVDVTDSVQLLLDDYVRKNTCQMCGKMIAVRS